MKFQEAGLKNGIEVLCSIISRLKHLNIPLIHHKKPSGVDRIEVLISKSFYQIIPIVLGGYRCIIFNAYVSCSPLFASVKFKKLQII